MGISTDLSGGGGERCTPPFFSFNRLAASASRVSILSMNDDYASAAARHLHDAKTLLSVERPDNAGYLAGYVAECGVKAVIEKAGVPLKKKWHLHQVSRDQLLVAADLSHAVRRYPVDLDDDFAALQRAWHTDLRYARTGSLKPGASRDLVDRAEGVWRKTIGAMVLDGVLESVPE